MRVVIPCLLLLLARGLGAATALPHFFGIYVEDGDRLYELVTHEHPGSAGDADAQELRVIGPVTLAPTGSRFLIYTGGATDLMNVPVRRLERVGQEVGRTAAVTPLTDIWYAHPSRADLRVAPVDERPGLLVRAEPAAPLPRGYWALEVKGRLFPFAVGEHAERAAGCLRRLSPGVYKPCRPPSPPPPPTAPPRRTGLETVGVGAAKFLGGRIQDVWETAVVRSTAGLLALLAIYAFVYWLILKVKDTYFLQVAPFRVWKKDAAPYLSEGCAARVVDELRRLQLDIRDHGAAKGARAVDLSFHELSQPIPAAAQVTIEFKGMSPDALNGFLRRMLGRHDLIMGDLFPEIDGRLLGRSSGGEAWEVTGGGDFDGTAMDHALRAFAVHAVVAVRPQSSKALANALAHRQGEAFDANDHEKAMRLAELGLIALPDEAKQHYNAGVAYGKLDRYDDAIAAYSAAIRRNPKMASAYHNRANAYLEQGRIQLAYDDLLEVEKLRPHDPDVQKALTLIRSRRESTAGGTPAGNGAAERRRSAEPATTSEHGEKGPG